MDPNLSLSARLIFVGLFVGLGLAFFLLPSAFWTGLRKRGDVRLSYNARWILAGLSLSLLLLLFPPFWYGKHQLVRQWHFFLDSQETVLWGKEKEERRLSAEGAVDLPMLFLEFLIGGVGVGAAWYVSTSLKDPEEV